MLVVTDIGGTLVYQGNQPPQRDDESYNEDFHLLKNRYVYVRPGCQEYISRVQNHPRVEFAFYSSMKQHNVIDVVDLIMTNSELEPCDVFDAEYCRHIDENERLRPLQ